MTRRRTAEIREVGRKTDAQIERETAQKWASRAIGCYAFYTARGDEAWLIRYENYRHEALEHAATVEDRGVTVRRVQDTIDREIKKYARRKPVESNRRRRG